MKIAVVGSGYVGLVTGACFANLGNSVVCLDNDRAKISILKKGQVPFYEPGLEDLVKNNLQAGRLNFSADLPAKISEAEIIFIAVGTPPKESGEADVSAVTQVAQSIAKVLIGSKKERGRRPAFKVIVNKSTVPVGMGDIVTRILVSRGVSTGKFAVVSNPEFLREGAAIADFMRPDRIVIGASHNRAFNVITELYRPLNAHIIFTSIKSAELIKYASNAFLATKISFINEIASVCERVGADVNEVAYAMGLDRRIGRDFLNAGLGYGGSCFPKDVAALIHLAAENGYAPRILNSVIEVNEFQIDAFVGKICGVIPELKGKKIAVLGLAFKPGTSDLREAPALKIIKRLRQKGALINGFDPCRKIKKIPGVKLCKDVYSAAKGAEAVVIATEWAEFQGLDFEKLRKQMKRPIMFDGRNIYNPKKMRDNGFVYQGVGR